MSNWKNTSLFGREILDDSSYATLQEVIRTQNFGEPAQAFKGAVMHRQPEELFKKAVSDFITNYRKTAASLISGSDALSPEEGRKAVELLKRCEILYGMSQTFTEPKEAFRRANVLSGKDYAGSAKASWYVLERKMGLGQSAAERGRIAVAHQSFY